MTNYVNPSNDFRPLSEEMGRVFLYSAHHDGFIADGSTLVADVDSVGLGAGPFNAFAKAGETGLNVDIDTGEAVIQGAIVAKDTTTTVSLPASSSPTVYVGWDPAVENGIIIDHGGNFTSEPKIPLYDFTTDTSNVTGQTDRRTLGQHVDVLNKRYETNDGSGIQVDNADRLDGLDSTAYAELAQGETVTGQWTFNDVILSDRAGTDFMRLSDGSGGSNTDPYTLVFDSRDLRLYSGGVGTALTVAQNRDVILPGNTADSDASATTLVDASRYGSVTIPICHIPAGNRARQIVASGPDYSVVRIIGFSLLQPDASSVPTGVELDIKDQGGGQGFLTGAPADSGTYDNPLHTMTGLGSFRVEIHNGTSSAVDAAAQVDYIKT